MSVSHGEKLWLDASHDVACELELDLAVDRRLQFVLSFCHDQSKELSESGVSFHSARKLNEGRA